MRGYYMEPLHERTIITSDLGEIKNNFIYIRGRDENIAISGGENINTDYIKNILLQHSAIESVSMQIIKDIKWGELITADLILNTNQLNITDIQDWCYLRMPKYAVPKIIRIVTK